MLYFSSTYVVLDKCNKTINIKNKISWVVIWVVYFIMKYEENMIWVL